MISVSDLDWYTDVLRDSIRTSDLLRDVALDSKVRREYRERGEKCRALLKRLGKKKVTCDFCRDECETTEFYRDYVVWHDDETIICKECLRGRMLYVDSDDKQWKMEAANVLAPIPFPLSLLKIPVSFFLWLRRIERCPICGHKVDTWILGKPLETVSFHNKSFHRYCFIQELNRTFSNIDLLVDEWRNPKTFYIEKDGMQTRVRRGMRTKP